jgi:tRNA 2-selenouridine synthase
MSVIDCQFQDLVSELNEIPWFDARSENEFLRGHIPGSTNLPILNNEHRHLVGICYKEKGKEKAIELGFELATPLFPSLIQEAKKYGNKAVVYCWRGGLRSKFLSELLSNNGFTVYRIEGGYKTYRNWCLDFFQTENRMIILSGKTGTNKTKWIESLRDHGEACIHLESLANHKGSTFGGIGQPPQPTQEQFENDLGLALYFTKGRRYWIENESRFIGKVRIPDALFNQFTVQPHIQIELELEQRIQVIYDQYATLPQEDLIEKTLAVAKRMGFEQNKKALEFLEANLMHDWIKTLLEYYDKTYAHSKARSNISGKIYHMEISRATSLSDFISIKNKIENEINGI